MAFFAKFIGLIIVVIALTAAAGFASEAIAACEAVDYVGNVTVQGVEMSCSTLE